MNIELIVNHGDVAIKVTGKEAEVVVSQYKNLLWELGYPVQGGKPFATDFMPARMVKKEV